MFSLYPRRAAAVALLLAGVLAGQLERGTAHAAIACRSDPVLVVDGAIVDVVSTLQTSADTVRELDYTITVPFGSLIGQTRLTVGLGFPEKVTYVFSAAQPWGTMQIAASVVTAPGVAAFPTTVQATSLLARGTASGSSDQTVVLLLGNQLML